MKDIMDLRVGDAIEISMGTGTQRGVVTTVTLSGKVWAIIWRVHSQTWSKNPKQVTEDNFIDVVREAMV